jgi:hypothetical protein
MPSDDQVDCKVHGTQPGTLVCQHIVAALQARQRVGFFWTTVTSDNPRPDAWCKACNARVEATGGEWIGEALENLEPKVLCGACYDLAKTFHLGGNPWS